jgi:hypothetical protein
VLDRIVADLGPVATAGSAVTVQFDTPGSSSVANTEALIRGIPGVRSANTTSLALGGVSLMRVVVEDPALFAASLQSRGYQVVGSGTTLRIRRPAAPTEPSQDDRTTQ